MQKQKEFDKIANLFGLESKDLYLLLRNPDIYYCTYKIPKRSGGYREISSPSLKLMEIQRAISKQLLEINYPPPKGCIGFIKGKNIKDNVIPHLKHPYVLKTDIKNFFPSIKKKQVQDVFKSFGYSSKISHILATLCCKNGALPQGAPTSPIISNIIMRDIDLKINEYCEKNNLVYTRYADDITISSMVSLPINFLKDLQEMLSLKNMFLNPKKTHFYGPNNKKIITGISISSGEIKLPRKTKRMWRQEINMIKKFGILQHMKNTHNLNPLIIPVLKGKLAFWKQIEPDNNFIFAAYKILDEAVEELKNK